MTSTATEKPNRQVRRKQKTREKLLVAANEIFLEKGVDNTTVTDIADRADVAYGTFYNYFKSVEDLVPVAVEEILLNHQLEVKELQSQHQDPAMRVAVGVHTLFRNVMSGPAIKWLTQKPTVMADELAKIVADDAMADIREGVESGDFQIPCDFTTLRTFVVWGVTGVLNEASKHPEQLQKFSDGMTQTYLRILGVNDVKAGKLVQSCAAQKT